MVPETASRMAPLVTNRTPRRAGHTERLGAYDPPHLLQRRRDDEWLWRRPSRNFNPEVVHRGCTDRDRHGTVYVEARTSDEIAPQERSTASDLRAHTHGQNALSTRLNVKRLPESAQPDDPVESSVRGQFPRRVFPVEGVRAVGLDRQPHRLAGHNRPPHRPEESSARANWFTSRRRRCRRISSFSMVGSAAAF